MDPGRDASFRWGGRGAAEKPSPESTREGQRDGRSGGRRSRGGSQCDDGGAGSKAHVPRPGEKHEA